MTDKSICAGGYNDEQILSASPEHLTLMLYNGAIDFVSKSIAAAGEKDFSQSLQANLRVQGILREFMATLDLRYDVAKNLMSLYEYMERQLQMAANEKTEHQKSINLLEEVRTLLTELRDTWQQAILIKN